MTDLYIIRHGEAVVNVEPIIGGMKGDTGLTPRGRQQATLLEARLSRGDIVADVLYASTLPRAMETAAYVSRALRLPIRPDDDVQELRPGSADGMSIADYERIHGWPNWERDPYRAMSPGGESWATFLVRCGQTISRLAHVHAGQSIVIVAHGGVIDSMFFNFFGLNAIATSRVGFHTMNTSITHWRFDTYLKQPNSERWILVRYNDTTHLNAMAPYSEPTVPLPGHDAS